jgi:hypothetical protein
MADTTFTNGSTLTDAGWFNDVNDLVYSGTFPSGITNLNPDANDGAALGASGTAWSDLFLASGAVINFNAGNFTLTHSAGVLTASGQMTVTGLLAGGSDFQVPSTGRIYLDNGSDTYIHESSANVVRFTVGGSTTLDISSSLTVPTGNLQLTAGVAGIGIAVDGGTTLNTAAGTTTRSSLRVPHGSAPTSPVDGDMWTTTAGLFVRINGSTVGPLS